MLRECLKRWRHERRSGNLAGVGLTRPSAATTAELDRVRGIIIWRGNVLIFRCSLSTHVWQSSFWKVSISCLSSLPYSMMERMHAMSIA